MINLKFIHISDLHLDTPFIGIEQELPKLHKKLLQAPYNALERSVNIALNERVDFILISGDIYNSQRQSIYAQHFFMQQLEKLNQQNIPVIIGYGNHDYIRDESRNRKYPDNVKVFTSDEVSYFDLTLTNEEIVRVYGFSYETQWIKERKIAQFPFNTLETDYTLGILHGSLEGLESDSGNYAPFSVKELLSKNYDYWALGHIHKAQVLNEVPLIQYPGTIQGRHRNESGDKGCYLVEINKGQPIQNTFHSLASVVWESTDLDCQSQWQASDLVEQIQQIVSNFRDEAQANRQIYILDIRLNNAERLASELLEQVQAGELYDVLEIELEDETSIFINQILPELSLSYEVFEFDKSLKESFNHVIEDLYTGSRFKTATEDLTNHSIVKQRLMIENDPEFQEESIDHARLLIAQLVDLDPRVEGENLED